MKEKNSVYIKGTNQNQYWFLKDGEELDKFQFNNYM